MQTIRNRVFPEICAFFRSISWVFFQHMSRRAITASISLQSERKPKVVEKKPLTVHDIREIPPSLYKDSVFSKFICPITQSPIRFIVLDPNRKTCYEKNAIIRWLQEYSVSPVTRKPLHLEDLISAPSVQCLIDRRLSEYLQLQPQIFQPK